MNFIFALLAGLLAFSYAKRTDELAKPLNSRIYNDQEAIPGEFPHQISLYKKYKNISRHFCGGSIINDYWILTATCGLIDPEYVYYVLAGKHDLAKHGSSEQTIIIKKSFLHIPSSAKYDRPYDIGLFKLTRPLVFNEYVQPIALPETYSDLLGEVVLLGWKHYNADNSILQKTYLSIIDLETCKKMIDKNMEYLIEADNLCTIPNNTGLRGGQNSSQLIKINKNSVTELVGIPSWRVMLPRSGYGELTIFTRISSFINWINTIVNTN